MNTCSLTASHKWVGIMQLSTTAIAIVSFLSEITIALECNRSAMIRTLLVKNPPLTVTGNFRGVISTCAAPALRSARAF